MRVSELNGQGSAVWLALSTFSVVRVLRGLGGFLFVSLPVVLNDVTIAVWFWEMECCHDARY